MKTAFAVISLFTLAGAGSAPGPQLTLMRAGERPTIPGPAANFTGSAVIDRQTRPEDPGRAMGSLVSFQPGARTAWHTHPLGQTLIVTSGCGWVQTEGGKPQEILPGDVVWIPANARHWHGAQADAAMSHYAFVEPLNGKNVEWMEQVSNEQYSVEKSSRCQVQKASLEIQEQGSFAIGGKLHTEPGAFDALKPTLPAGQTFRGDHAAVSYQIPVKARRFPLVLWHGAGQSSRTWQTTADGREGFQSIFLRRKFAVYLIDQPRRGQAGRSVVEATIKPIADEQFWFNQFRIGNWPNYFPGVQFDRDPETLNQYFRAMVPNTGPFDAALVSDATSALFDRVGPGILVTHSQSGGPGWLTAIKNQNVRAIVAFEPGSGFVFPEGELPPPMPSAAGTLEGVAILAADFAKLTRIPIVIYYGDNIPRRATTLPGQDNWRVRLDMAKLWRDAVNRHGGNVTLVHLPELGIRGNTHFPFSDTNNVQIADLMSKYLELHKLD